MARIAKQGLNITGMEAISVVKHYCVLLRMPFVNIAEGPKWAYLAELWGMHYIGRLLVELEIRHPRVYRIYVRVRNSAVFRYNRYWNVLRQLGGRVTRKYRRD